MLADKLYRHDTSRLSFVAMSTDQFVTEAAYGGIQERGFPDFVSLHPGYAC